MLADIKSAETIARSVTNSQDHIIYTDENFLENEWTLSQLTSGLHPTNAMNLSHQQPEEQRLRPSV